MLRSKDNLYNETIEFIIDAKELVMISPYIKRVALEKLLDNTQAKEICVITSWKPRDIKFGSTDLDMCHFL